MPAPEAVVVMSKDQLKKYHAEKGIKFVVFDVNDLIDALHIEDIPTLQQIMQAYADHRETQGRVDGDLSWALRALVDDENLELKRAGDPLCKHVAGLLSTRLSPPIRRVKGPDGSMRTVVPDSSRAVGPEHPKVQKWIESLRNKPDATMQALRRELS